MAHASTTETFRAYGLGVLGVIVVIAVLIGTLQMRFPGYLAAGVWYAGYGEPWRALVNALSSTNLIKVSIDQRSIIRITRPGPEPARVQPDFRTLLLQANVTRVERTADGVRSPIGFHIDGERLFTYFVLDRRSKDTGACGLLPDQRPIGKCRVLLWRTVDVLYVWSEP